jgi:hypothetical protein
VITSLIYTLKPYNPFIRSHKQQTSKKVNSLEEQNQPGRQVQTLGSFFSERKAEQNILEISVQGIKFSS